MTEKNEPEVGFEPTIPMTPVGRSSTWNDFFPLAITDSLVNAQPKTTFSTVICINRTHHITHASNLSHLDSNFCPLNKALPSVLIRYFTFGNELNQGNTNSCIITF